MSITQLPSDACMARGGPGYFVKCPSLFGHQFCGAGKTESEARRNAIETINAYMERRDKLISDACEATELMADDELEGV